MVEQEWAFSKPGQGCCLCNRTFVPEQRYFSALLQTPEKLLRQDYCDECFQGRRPENVYYFWKRTQADPENDSGKRQRPVVDVEYVLEFFRRLSGENAPQKVAFRYILALMLVRKKLLVLENKQKDAAGNDVLLYREKREATTHLVVEPPLSESEIESVSAELGVLLGLNAPAKPAAQPGTSPTPAENNGQAAAAMPVAGEGAA